MHWKTAKKKNKMKRYLPTYFIKALNEKNTFQAFLTVSTRNWEGHQVFVLNLLKIPMPKKCMLCIGKAITPSN